MLVADLPDSFEVAGRGHEDAVGADHGLEHDRRDGAGAFDHDRLAQVLQGSCGLLLRGGGVEGRAVEVGAPEVHDPGHARLGRPAAGVAGEHDRAARGAMVAAVGGEHLVPAGVQAGHPDRVLVGVRAAVGEEDLVEVTGRELGQEAGGLGAHVVGEGRRDGALPSGVLLDRGDELGVLVADVDVDQLGGEVEVLLPLVVPEVRAAGVCDGQRVDLGLRGPGVENVRPVVAAHLLLGEIVGQHGAHLVRGKPRSTCEVAGSGQREVTTLPRV